jgi:uncharacterized membrane protein
MAADSGGDFLISPGVGLAIWFVVFVVMVAAIVVLVVWLVRRDRLERGRTDRHPGGRSSVS